MFDDEGTPTRRKEIVTDGVFRGFIRNAFCGDSTGNGMRRSSADPLGIYDRPPAVKPQNLVVK